MADYSSQRQSVVVSYCTYSLSKTLLEMDTIFTSYKITRNQNYIMLKSPWSSSPFLIVVGAPIVIVIPSCVDIGAIVVVVVIPSCIAVGTVIVIVIPCIGTGTIRGLYCPPGIPYGLRTDSARTPHGLLGLFRLSADTTRTGHRIFWQGILPISNS